MITNKQEIFNAAYIGLSKQDWMQSIDEFGQCLYRGPGGTKCAIGFCISDEEALLFDSLDDASMVCITLLPKYNMSIEEVNDMADFTMELQVAHDNYVGVDMKNAFESFAKKHNLDIPEVE